MDEYYDEGDESREIDYGEYKDSDNPELVVGYIASGNLGEGYEEGFDEANVTAIGKGANKLEKSRRNIEKYLDPTTLFVNNVQTILTSTKLNLNKLDLLTINNNIGELNLIEYKNVTSYILGYNIYKNLNRTEQTKRNLSDMLKESNNKGTNIFELLKYARFWERILSKK